MKHAKRIFFASAVSASLFIINGCQKEVNFSDKTLDSRESTLLQAASNITVAGGGTTLEFGKLTTYEVNAVQHNGVTKGQILLKFRAAGGSLFVKVDCLRLFDGNKATVSGVIWKIGVSPHANPDFPPPPFVYIGGRVSLTVEDNGEGGADPADLVSDIGQLDPAVPASCEDEAIVYLPLDGNIQIKK